MWQYIETVFINNTARTVYNGGYTNQFLILEQNFDGNANMTATLR